MLLGEGYNFDSLRASSPIWASEASLATMREREWKPFITELYLFVSSTLFSSENRESESEEWFKRCFPTSVSSPGWILLGRKIQKHVLDSVAV